MNDHFKTHISFIRFKSIIFLILIILMSVPLASAHGPKGHGTEFTALDAAKKGIELYDKLLTSGKIEESWETDLKNIRVLPRQSGERKEVIVKFSRGTGEPQSLYIYFSEKGEYSGSNFTGK
jgi:hypothetical protein